MTSALAPQVHERSEAFGFTCSRCSRCCHDKIIQVNPYEVARLARSRGLSTRAFAERHTEDGLGVHLKRVASGACEFLGAQGCTVHADRPLVCRLYPLGRHVSEDGAERFSHMTPHPQSEGSFHRDGTIGGYIEAQGAAPFMAAADAYFAWTCRAYAQLAGDGGDDAAVDGTGEDILDMDSAIECECALTGAAEPLDIEARLALHLQRLDRRLAEVETGRQS